MAVKKELLEERKEDMFNKEQILYSKKYSNRRDALGVVLKEETLYTTAQVDELLEKFMKGKVK